MDTLLAIASRRDERRTLPEALPSELVLRLLDAGRLSGSSRNSQPWVFVVPTGRARVEELAGAVFVPENVLGAGLVVAILVHGKGPVLFDAGRAAQSMLLAAWAAGIASCPNGISDLDRARDALAAGERRDAGDRPLVRAPGAAARPRAAYGGGVERPGEPQADRRRREVAPVTRMKGGLDLGGTKIQAVVTDGAATVLGAARRDTPRRGGPDAIVLELAEALREALDDAGVEPLGLAGIGVGAPGSIDASTGIVDQVPNIDGWDGPFALGPALAAEMGRTVTIGNDVNVAVDAERVFGAGRGVASFLGVFWGTGVGGGIVMDGRPLVGRGSAGEIGHVCSKPGGRRCNCGLEGCVEAYAGRGALEERARELAKERPTILFELMEKRGRDRLTSGVWLRALQAGDEVAESLIQRAVQALGVGIGSAVTLLDVEAVVIGGGLGERLGSDWLSRIEAAASEHTFFRDSPEYRLAELGDLGGAIGASLLEPPT